MKKKYIQPKVKETEPILNASLLLNVVSEYGSDFEEDEVKEREDWVEEETTNKNGLW